MSELTFPRDDRLRNEPATTMPPRHSLPSQGARRTGRPTLEATAALQTRILQSAFEAFVRLGIEGASMEGISHAARVSKRTLYMRFGSKKALLVAALRYRATSGLDTICSPPAGSLRDRILSLAEKLIGDALTPEAIGLEFLIREVVKSYPDIPLKELTPGTAPL
ncbi:MAG: TetR/AcrR family transcriptional regulator, partial [Sphingobium sp.]